MVRWVTGVLFVLACMAFALRAVALRAADPDRLRIVDTAKSLQGRNQPEANRVLNEGIAKFQKLTATSPNDAELWNDLATLNLERKLYPDAHAAIDKALALNPQTPEYHYTKAIVFRAEKKLVESDQEYRQTIALAPKVARYYWNYSYLLWDRDQRVKSFAMTRRAIELDPTEAKYYEWFAQQTNQLQRGAEFMMVIKKAVAEHPDSPELRATLAMNLLNFNRELEAIEHFRVYADLRPDALQPQTALLCALTRANKTEGAAIQLAKIRDMQKQGKFPGVALFTREYFHVGEFNVTVEEYFEPLPAMDPIRYQFHVYHTPSGRLLNVFKVSSSEFQTDRARSEGRIKAGERMWHLDQYQGDIRTLIESYRVNPPPYEEVRARIVKFLDTQRPELPPVKP